MTLWDWIRRRRDGIGDETPTSEQRAAAIPPIVWRYAIHFAGEVQQIVASGADPSLNVAALYMTAFKTGMALALVYPEDARAIADGSQSPAEVMGLATVIEQIHEEVNRG